MNRGHGLRSLRIPYIGLLISPIVIMATLLIVAGAAGDTEVNVIKQTRYVAVIVSPFDSEYREYPTAADSVYVTAYYSNLPFCYSWGYAPGSYYWIWTGNPNPSTLYAVYQVTLYWY